jgi:polyisoprenoid-binding protein YceI
MLARVCARLLTVALFISPTIAAAQEAAPIDIHGGTAVFDVATNVSAISVHGKTTAIDGHARVRQTDSGLMIEQLEATAPVASLSTGMGLRDTHMRKYVFTGADGQTPDLRFEAARAACAGVGGSGFGGIGGASREMTCQVAGLLTIRGVSKPFAMALRVSASDAGAGNGGNTPVFRASGDTTITLSAWGIERPSQLGVQTADDVKLHLEFTGKPSASVTTTAAWRGGR